MKESFEEGQGANIKRSENAFYNWKQNERPKRSRKQSIFCNEDLQRRSKKTSPQKRLPCHNFNMMNNPDLNTFNRL